MIQKTQVTRGIEEERGCRPVTVQFEKYTVTNNKEGCPKLFSKPWMIDEGFLTHLDLNRVFGFVLPLQDKASVLQKAKMLKGTNVLVSDILPMPW